MKRKIVFIINSLKNGGPVNMLYTLIKHVDANKFDMYVIALSKLQQKIDSLGLKEDFLLLGAKENPYPYYKQCDLYVHATRF